MRLSFVDGRRAKYVKSSSFHPSSFRRIHDDQHTTSSVRDQNPTASFVSAESAGSLNLAFSESSLNESTRFCSLATNSIKRDVKVARERALALS
ncbi:hypothetical protein AAHA92_24259 [Salvia divinorum]|uniref:Uncharacterized protein n=1 Tax=Salvia divinorum TaxID=28513 RepID=A0ABD1G9Z4_SALDI